MDKELAKKRLDFIKLNSKKIKNFADRIAAQEDKNRSITAKRLKKIKDRAERIDYFSKKLKEQLDEPEPPNPPEKPSALKIHGNEIFFKDGGLKKFIGVGVWRREALLLETKQEGHTWPDCGQKYSLAWCESEFHKYGLNYLRTDICKDTQLLFDFCKRMAGKDVIVELTLRDGDRDLGSIDETIQATKNLKNIIYEVWNEMYSLEDVQEAVSLAKKLKKQGLIISGGAIGAGGEKWATEAANAGLYELVDIIQVHRHWPYPAHENNDWVLKYKDHNKPIGRNEFFDRKKLGLEKTRFIFEKSIQHGASLVNYYGFRMPGLGAPDCQDAEGNPYWRYLQIASDIKQKYFF